MPFWVMWRKDVLLNKRPEKGGGHADIRPRKYFNEILLYLDIKGNGPGKRKFDNMGKREKAAVITLEDRMDPSAKRSIGHVKEYKQCY